MRATVMSTSAVNIFVTFGECDELQRVLFSQKIKAKIERRRGEIRFAPSEPFLGYFFNNLSVRGAIIGNCYACVHHWPEKINTVTAFKALLGKLWTINRGKSYTESREYYDHFSSHEIRYNNYTFCDCASNWLWNLFTISGNYYTNLYHYRVQWNVKLNAIKGNFSTSYVVHALTQFTGLLVWLIIASRAGQKWYIYVRDSSICDRVNTAVSVQKKMS